MGKTTIIDQTEEFAKFTGPSVQKVFKDDKIQPSDAMKQTSYQFIGDEDISIDRYTSQDWHDREVEKVWKKTWQMACRVEEIPNEGDYYVYEIADDSVIVCRQPDGTIKAYVNACLHRGNGLCEGSGNKSEFRCPFHGYTWTLEGKLRWIPAQWDFPHLDKEEFSLHEINVDTWGGFVFINLDDDAAPLEEFLELLPEHLDGDEYANRFKAVHVTQVVPCNWKVVQEAFVEGYHVAETHFNKDENHQVLPEAVAVGSADTQTQYDIWPGVRHINRLILTAAIPSGYIAHKIKSEQEIVDAMLRRLPEESRPKLKDGEKARQALAEFNRNAFGQLHDVDYSEYSDSMMLDQIQYSVFPNFTLWPTVGAPLIYRFRPHGNNPDEAIFEVWFLQHKPKSGEFKVAEEIRLEPGQDWASVPELGGYGPIIDQDMPNLRTLQKGLKTTRKPGITLANYQEVRIRHFHKTLDEYLAASD